ncbi:GntR family transcriptional regulator [Spirillospora sp. NPDC048819]|uniref:GntR family transcriptional regulator n=1 Tax=Spirillospora sp. NPDC048819 TaxID=3155268 RepID=UPI0033CFFDCD
MDNISPGNSTYHRPPTALQAVVAELRRLIVQGVLPPSTHLSQVEIAEHLGVSRVPIREAMRILEGEGRIRYEPHRGYFVAEIDFDKIDEIYRIRELLETEAAVETLALAPPDLVDRMRELNESMRAAEDSTVLTVANRSFHFQLIQPSNMPTLTKMLDDLWNTTDPYRSVYFAESENRKAAYDEHNAIIDAVEAGTVDEVLRLLNSHRMSAIEGLKTLVKQHTNAPGR